MPVEDALLWVAVVLAASIAVFIMVMMYAIATDILNERKWHEKE